MANYQFQYTIPYFTNLPTDVITNDWSMFWPIGTPAESDFENARDRLMAFYSAVYQIGGGSNTGAPWVVFADASLKVYNRGDAPPRAPVYEAAAPITADQAASSYLPPEAAICLSFQAAQVSGVPQSRRRGRVFLGGFGIAMTPGDDNEFPVVDPIIRLGICSAAEDLLAGLTTDGWVWSVWSRVNASGSAVTNGWVDDAIDTQRRRGVAPTVRTLFP